MIGIGRKNCAIFIFIMIILFVYYFNRRSNDENNYTIVEQIGIKNYKVKILPKDHLNSVRLEVDGDVNMDYWREILFGVDHHLVSPTNKDLALKLIRKIFHLNDENHDKFLDKDEIFTLITNNIKGHIARAMKAHKEAFKMLDTQNKGLIRWEDFVTKYLQLEGKSKHFITEYLKKWDENMLTKTENGVLSNTERRWKESDLNEDNILSEIEYLGFIHPELNNMYLDKMCDKILMHLDKNMDGQLTEEEFLDSSHNHNIDVVTPYPGFVEAEEDKDISNDDEPSRRREFKEQIDTNQDGIASRQELLDYINPKNVANTRKDVKEIVNLLDQDKDGRLSLMEMMENYQKVMNSKMVNVAATFHDDDL